jgi:hypothetical protein
MALEAVRGGSLFLLVPFVAEAVKEAAKGGESKIRAVLKDIAKHLEGK